MRVLNRLSRLIFKAELLVSATLVFAIFALMLASVAASTMFHPLNWTDELCVHLMVILAFVGASLATYSRSHMTMGLLGECLTGRKAQLLQRLCDMLILAFLLSMLWIIWAWADLPALLHAGSIKAYEAQSFNFIYSDPTQTLGLRKIWFWAIMPISTITAIIHVLAQITTRSTLAGARDEVTL